MRVLICVAGLLALCTLVSGRGVGGVHRPDGVNVARYKNVFATSTLSRSYGVSKAVDGSGNWATKCFRAGKEANGYIRINLGKPTAIHAVELFTSEKAGSNAKTLKEQDRNLEVRIGMDKDNIEANPLCTTFGDPYMVRHDSAYCEKELCGQYIFIQRKHDSVSSFTICEFLAFSLTSRETCTPEAPTTTTTTTTTPAPTTTTTTTPAPTTTTTTTTTPAPTTTSKPEEVQVCTMAPGVGTCSATTPRFAYSLKKGKCRPFDGCAEVEGANSFASLEECNDACGDFEINPDCLLPKEAGTCDGKEIRYFFSTALGKCKKFKYSGCDGNANNFASKSECKSSCK